MIIVGSGKSPTSEALSCAFCSTNLIASRRSIVFGLSVEDILLRSINDTVDTKIFDALGVHASADYGDMGSDSNSALLSYTEAQIAHLSCTNSSIDSRAPRWLVTSLGVHVSH